MVSGVSSTDMPEMDIKKQHYIPVMMYLHHFENANEKSTRAVKVPLFDGCCCLGVWLAVPCIWTSLPA